MGFTVLKLVALRFRPCLKLDVTFTLCLLADSFYWNYHIIIHNDTSNATDKVLCISQKGQDNLLETFIIVSAFNAVSLKCPGGGGGGGLFYKVTNQNEHSGGSTEFLPVSSQQCIGGRCLCGYHRLVDFLSACIGGLWMRL